MMDPQLLLPVPKIHKRRFAKLIPDKRTISHLSVVHREGKGNGNPRQYSCLENPVDRGGWCATVHGAAHSWT